MRGRLHCESSQCGFIGLLEADKQRPCFNQVIVRIERTSWTVVEGLELRVGIFLALWRVDGCVIIWSFLERFWVSFC
jgi:hypothetical protein